MTEYDPELHDDLAGKVQEAYRINPHLTINICASQLNAQMNDVAFVLDSFDASSVPPKYIGPGQGGEWVGPDHQAQMRPLNIEEVGQDTGLHRWPDGIMRGDPFDIENPDHLDQIGLKAETD